jgi:hypothetical protein
MTDFRVPYLACLECRALSIATRPLPLLNEWVTCPECGHRARFHAIVAGAEDPPPDEGTDDPPED